MMLLLMYATHQHFQDVSQKREGWGNTSKGAPRECTSWKGAQRDRGRTHFSPDNYYNRIYTTQDWRVSRNVCWHTTRNTNYLFRRQLQLIKTGSQHTLPAQGSNNHKGLLILLDGHFVSPRTTIIHQQTSQLTEVSTAIPMWLRLLSPRRRNRRPTRI